MTIDPRERLRRIDPAPLDVEPPSGALGAVAVIHEIERRMGMDTRDTTNETVAPLGVTEQIDHGATETTTETMSDTPTKQAGKRRWTRALVAAAVLVVAVGASVLLTTGGGDDTATPVAGPVTFKTITILSDSFDVRTFTVTTGADVLGCSSGTFVREFVSPTVANHVMTCESGPSTGTFTIHHDRTGLWVWNVLESSDDFAGLQGEGGWDYVAPSSSTIVETFKGDIEYAP